MKHTDRLIDEARENVDVNGRSHTEWNHKDGECTSREYKLGYANWKHYGKAGYGNPRWCTDMVSLTLKVFADGKERKIFSLNNFGASRKNCEALIVSKAIFFQTGEEK
jgi:hypothetical protein